MGENLARLGAEVAFISAVGTDRFVRILRDGMAEAGMDCSRLVVRSGMSTGLYLALLEPSGVLFVAVNDMEAVESLAPADLEAAKDGIAASDLVVADANLNPATLEAIMRLAGSVPVMADTVSEHKAPRLTGILPHLQILKTNRAEAAALAGFSLDSEEALRRGCKKLLDTGLKSLYITLGAQGAYCADADGVYFQRTLPARLVNVNGAGDAFAAGVAYRSCLGSSSLAENAAFGAVCAAITVECDEAVCKTLNAGRVTSAAGWFK
jgi:pseudouridine kinase